MFGRTSRPLVVVVLGTRPELIKMAGAIDALKSSEGVASIVVFTGQHPELIEEAAATLEITPDVRLDPLPQGRTLTDLVGHVIERLGRIREIRSAAAVVVQGDTASAFAGAVVAELVGVPLIHVEAGVRSRVRDDPFPEETLRRIISTISELHVCFSSATRSNLLAEGVPQERIVLTPHPSQDRVGTIASDIGSSEPEVLVTLHRRERRQARAALLLAVLESHATKHLAGAVTFVWHPALDDDLPGFAHRLAAAHATVVPSIAPDAFLERLAKAVLVITDSAGMAEEAQLLGKPLLVLRDSAETRLDPAPTAPVCTTEDTATAIAFLHSLDPRDADDPACDPRPNPSAGQSIGSAIESFVSSG